MHICRQYVELNSTKNIAYYDCVVVIKSGATIKCCEFYNCLIKSESDCARITSCSLNSCNLRYNSAYYGWCDINDCIISEYANIYNSKVRDSTLQCSVTNSLIACCHIKSHNIKDCYAYNNSYEDNYCIPKEYMELNGQTYNVGYKKAKKMCHGRENFVIIKLLFDPEKSGCTGGDVKHRTGSVFIADIYSLDKKTHYKDAYSGFNESFKYTKGEWVSEPDTNINSLEICSTGIHFFFNEADAIEYCL